MTPDTGPDPRRAGAAIVSARVAMIDPDPIAAALDAGGYAVLPSLLAPEECAALAAHL